MHYTLEKGNQYRAAFIDNSHPIKEDEITNPMEARTVFVITNYINGHEYVGFTKDFGARAAELIRCTLSSENLDTLTPLCRAMKDFGIENFKIRRQYLAASKELAKAYTDAYIVEHQLDDPEHGYNWRVPEHMSREFSPETRKKISERKKGVPWTLTKKRAHGTAVIAINLDEKMILRASSAALFAGLVGLRADFCAHGAQKLYKTAGWFIVYIDNIGYPVMSSRYMKVYDKKPKTDEANNATAILHLMKGKQFWSFFQENGFSIYDAEYAEMEDGSSLGVRIRKLHYDTESERVVSGDEVSQCDFMKLFRDSATQE